MIAKGTAGKAKRHIPKTGGFADQTLPPDVPVPLNFRRFRSRSVGAKIQ
jgi:hypothetical protein